MSNNSLKITLLALACMMMVVPANAGINLSGYGELGSGIGTSASSTYYCFGSSDASCGSSGVHSSNTPWDLAGSLHLSTVVDTGVNLQLDVEGKNVRESPSPDDYFNYDKATTYGVGIHLDATIDEFRVGELISIGNANGAFFNNRLVSAGLEGAWLLNRTTLFSQLIYSHAVQGDFSDSGLNSLYLYTGARYFLRDNLMFEADAGAGTIESTRLQSMAAGTNYNGHAAQWSAKAEYRFSDLPVSLLFNYQGSYSIWRSFNAAWVPIPCGHGRLDYYSTTGTMRRTENLFMLSLHYYFGQDSLIANDRNGAGMNDYNPWYGAESVISASQPSLVVPAYASSADPGYC